MKKLILSLILIPFLASAENEMQISDNAIQSKFLTIVKDVEVENMLGKTAQFNTCREKNKFDPKEKDPNVINANLQAATQCFKDELAKNKNPKALQELAESLKLQNYGLIQSKNVGEITEYLSRKMRKSLTGVDYDDKDPKNLKWSNTKIVDQKVFIDLYTNQLMKSALLEVSRFCFENLEKIDSSKNGISKSVPIGTNFVTYWGINDMPMVKDAAGNSIPVITNIGDASADSFLNIATGTDLTKKEDVLKEIQKGIAGSDAKPDHYKHFLSFCQGSIKLLCADFRQDTTALQDAKDNKTTIHTKMSRGANACLTMDRLQGIRTTMANTEKVAKQFAEMGEKKGDFALQMLENPKIYQNGKGADEESLDALTSYSSADMLKDGGEDLSDLETRCAQDATSDECKEFLVVGDSLDKAIHNVESEMNLKREIEVATVKEIFDKPDELDKYLTDNGHFDLINRLKDKSLKPEDIEIELGKIYDARKVAEIDTLRLKVGKRQINEAEETKLGAGTKGMIEANIKDTKEERARLAQVVMFNNIITSQLELKDAQGNSVGRNVTGWNKEIAGMGGAYDGKLFEGIKGDALQHGSTRDDISISGGGIIDSILGKAP